MQKIKFEAPTGAELRQQMLDFLGMSESSCSAKISGNALLTDIARRQVVQNEVPDSHGDIIMKDAFNGEGTQTTIQGVDSNVAPENTGTTRKRRTKAEIEAEKAAAEQSTGTTVDQTPVVETNAETPEVETPSTEASGAPEITRAMLTEIVLAKGREGKKPLVMEEFAKFVQADGVTPVTGLPNLKPEDYAAVHPLLVSL